MENNTPSENEASMDFIERSKLVSYVTAATILDFIVTLHDLNCLYGFFMEDTLCPLFQTSEFHDDEFELVNQMVNSMKASPYVGMELMNQELPIEEQYNIDKYDIDDCVKVRIPVLLNLCQNKYKNFINRVASELYDNGYISGEDIASYFEADGGFDA